MPIPSLPDLEGVFDGGRQFIIEAKVCSQSAFALEKKIVKPRQVSHLLARAAQGVPCFIVIHFNERKLVRLHEPGETIALQVSDADPRWQRFVDAHAAAKKFKAAVQPQGSISREEAARIGTRVAWTCPKGSRKFLPDLAALLGVPEIQPSLL